MHWLDGIDYRDEIDVLVYNSEQGKTKKNVLNVVLIL